MLFLTGSLNIINVMVYLIMNECELFRDPTTDDVKAGKARRGRPRKWPFYDMEVGKMIAIDREEHQHQAKAAAQHTARVMGWKFKTAKMKNGVLLIKRIE